MNDFFFFFFVFISLSLLVGLGVMHPRRSVITEPFVDMFLPSNMQLLFCQIIDVREQTIHVYIRKSCIAIGDNFIVSKN